MTREPDDELTSELHDELRALAAGPAPPGRLEDRVVNALQQRGLLQSNRKPGTLWVRWLVPATACVAMFAAGFLLGRRQPSSLAKPAGDRFLMLLNRLDDAVASDSRQKTQRIQEYSEWAREQRETGHLEVGEKLNDNAVELSAAGLTRVPASGDLISGYFVIVAPNLDAALVIARTCPHLEHGGRITVRPIDRTP